MMKRDIHISPQALLESLQFRPGDFGKTALVSGQIHRAQMCLKKLENPVKNFTFLNYTFWTGEYKGRKITVGNGGFYAPDSAFVTEMLCAGGIDTFVRLGSCGALREDINIGDYVVADKIIRGDGATKYYVDESFEAKVSGGLTEKLAEVFSSKGRVHKGGVWTTDAIFRETKEIVNSYIEKGAVAVDMVTSPFITLANLYKKKSAVVLTVSDNLITGELGFADYRFFSAELKMIDAAFDLLEDYT